MNCVLVIVCGIIGILALLYQWRQNRVLRHRVDCWKIIANQMSEWWWSSATEKAKVLNEFADYRKFAESESAEWSKIINESYRKSREDGEVQAEMLTDLLAMSKERDDAVEKARVSKLEFEGAMMIVAQLQEKMEKGKKRSHKKGGK